MKHERFMDLWWQIRDALVSRHGRWVSFIYATRIRELLELGRVDILQFSTTLYAYDLLAQTVHHHSLPKIPNLDFKREGKVCDFPDGDSLGVTGIISTSGVRVCPALLPTMLLYPESSLEQAIDDDFYMYPNKDTEIKTWLAHRQAFDDRVKGVESEVACLLGECCEDLGDRESINVVRKTYLLEHEALDAHIRHRTRGGRRG